MNRKYRILVAMVLALAASGALAAAWTLLASVPASRVTTSGTAAIGGPFTLVAEDGKTVTDQTYRGKWLLIFFGYTYCPDACPTALNNISVALQKLGTEADRIEP